MTSNGQTTATDTLLFVAETFFLPPYLSDVLPSPNMRSMNSHISEKHPWVLFNRALSSLCTRKAFANNVFAIMLLPTPLKGFRGTPTNVKTLKFICADNWGDSSDSLRSYIKDCIAKILAAKAEADDAETKGYALEPDSPAKTSFIICVYKYGWEKFCERMKKNNNRGRRLLELLRRFERSNVAKPANLRSLIGAVSRVLDAIHSPLKPSNYLEIHNACMEVHREAFEDRDTYEWINTALSQTSDANLDPIRILQKMVKLRNGIENLLWLRPHENMQLTFKAAQAVPPNQLITWAEAPENPHQAFQVDLQYSNRQGMWRMYNDVFQPLSSQQKEIYASTQEVWLQIKKGMDNINRLPPNDHRPNPNGRIFKFASGRRNQHCEGKLVRYVMEKNLLGKAFPYIGCSKRCCEPCFTFIRAVNTVITNRSKSEEDEYRNFSEDQCFVVSDTHRKVYPRFGITPITDGKFMEDVIQEFQKLLCLDIGLVVKKGSEKGFGDSDSGPEPANSPF